MMVPMFENRTHPRHLLDGHALGIALAASRDRSCGMRSRYPHSIRLMVALLLAGLVAACSSTPADLGVSVATELVVEPTDSFALGVGQSLQLRAIPITSEGEVVAGYAVSWTSSDSGVADVTDEGLVSGMAQGLATIEVLAERQSLDANGGDVAVGLSKEVFVSVEAPVASVEVEPSEAEIRVGGVVQLLAVLRDGGGNPLVERYVSWSSSDENIATVDDQGLVTGVAEGTASIQAMSEGISGTSTVTVTSSSQEIIIFEDDFESGDLSLWDEFDATKYAVTSDPARVKSGDYSMQGKMFPSDDWGELNKWFLPGYDEVFVRFDVMFEEGFQNLRSDNNGMHFFAQMGNRVDDKWSASGKAGIRPDGTDFFVTVLDPEQYWSDATLRPLLFYSYFPDMSCEEVGCYGNLFEQEPPKIEIKQGEWQEIVFRVKANTPGSHDGGQTLWIDGVKKIDVENMRWRDTYDLRLNQISFWMYMPGAPKTEHIWIDNLVVWRPGTP